MQQTPCPYRIIDDAGTAFSMGAVGGAVWHVLRGAKNSPRGDRIRGGLSAMALRAPATGSGFAIWGSLFGAYDCGIQHLRRTEDPWNSIFAGGATGATLAIRSGAKSMGKNALVGAGLLAMIEGLMALAGKFQPATIPNPLPTPLGEKQKLLSPLQLAQIGEKTTTSFSPDYALQEMNSDVFDNQDMFSLTQDIETEASSMMF